MFTPGRRRRRDRLIRPERRAPAFLSQNARGGQPIRGRERSSRSIYRQGRSAPFTGINNSRDHTIGRRLRGSRRLAPSGWAVTFKPIGPVGRKRLAVVEAEQDRPTALAIVNTQGDLRTQSGNRLPSKRPAWKSSRSNWWTASQSWQNARVLHASSLGRHTLIGMRLSAFAIAGAAIRATRPLRKARRGRTRLLMCMLSFVCTRIGEQGPIVARMGHIVIHHRCRSRLVGGAEALSGCSATYINCESVFQANAIANPKIENFVDIDELGIMDPSQELTKARYRWLAERYPREDYSRLGRARALGSKNPTSVTGFDGYCSPNGSRRSRSIACRSRALVVRDNQTQGEIMIRDRGRRLLHRPWESFPSLPRRFHHA